MTLTGECHGQRRQSPVTEAAQGLDRGCPPPPHARRIVNEGEEQVLAVSIVARELACLDDAHQVATKERHAGELHSNVRAAAHGDACVRRGQRRGRR